MAGGKELLTAKRAWTCMAIGIMAYELACPEGELLSEGADRAIERHPMLVPLTALVIAGHVANLFPDRYDPIHLGFTFLKGQ